MRNMEIKKVIRKLLNEAEIALGYSFYLEYRKSINTLCKLTKIFLILDHSFLLQHSSNNIITKRCFICSFKYFLFIANASCNYAGFSTVKCCKSQWELIMKQIKETRGLWLRAQSHRKGEHLDYSTPEDKSSGSEDATHSAIY